MQKYRSILAKITLASIFLTILLSIHFHIWSGTYTEGDLEYTIYQQMEIIEESTGFDFSLQDAGKVFFSFLSFGVLTAFINLLAKDISIYCSIWNNDQSKYFHSLVARKVRLNC